MFNIFLVIALSRASIFALGIMLASIIIQLLTAIHHLAELKKKVKQVVGKSVNIHAMAHCY